MPYTPDSVFKEFEDRLADKNKYIDKLEARVAVLEVDAGRQRQAAIASLPVLVAVEYAQTWSADIQNDIGVAILSCRAALGQTDKGGGDA